MTDILQCAAQARCTQLLNCLNCYIPCVVGNTYYEAGNTATYSAAYSCGCSNAYTALCTSRKDGANTFYNSANTGGYSCAAYKCWQENQSSLQQMPWCTTYYESIPTLPGGTSTTPGTNPDTGGTFPGFKVCATNLCAGSSCTWTVPAGVKLARFQLWGAGGHSGSGCCCGGSPPGATGAYASMIIPVTPGCQYSIYAGCACCCNMGWHVRTDPYRAGSSYVTGYGLSNFCADGGSDYSMCYNYYLGMCHPYIAGCCRYRSPDCFTAGACSCNSGNDFCFSSSCATCGWVWFSVDKGATFNGCYTGNITSTPLLQSCLYYGTEVAGFKGSFAAGCFNTSFYGMYKHPPIYGFQNVSQCCLCFASSSVGGPLCDHFDYGYRVYPGAAGEGVALYAGCTILCNAYGSCGGGRGRSGMVCVTYW